MNKLTKVLSVFLIAGAIGTGVAGAAGCAHKHTFDENKWETTTGSETHWHPATCGHDVKKDEEKHADTNGDGKCDKCEAAMSSETPGDKLVIKKEVDGLIVEGVTGGDVQLSKEKKSHDIDKTAIKVYAAVGSTKGDEIPAANLDIKLTDPAKAEVTDWRGLKTNGTYKIDIKLKNAEMEAGAAATVADLATTVSINIKNAVVANSLKLTGGTTEQKQGTDSITSTWTYEVERANGDKVVVAAKDVMNNVNTMVAGEDKTATITATVDGVECTGSVKYKIIVNTDTVTQSFALNFSNLTKEQEDAIKAQAENTHTPLVLQDGRFAVCSTKSGSIDSHGKSLDGKYFAKRLKMNGKSNGDKCPRYIKVHADGPAMLTVYAYCNAGTEGTESERLVSVYGSMTVTTEGNITATFDNKVGESQATTEKTDTKHTFTISEAGDYYIACEVNGVCFTYVQLDQQVSAVGNEEITLGGNVVASSVSATHSSGKSAHVSLGTTFDSIKSAYTVKVLGVNDVTCASGETDVTGDAKVTFEVPEDFTTAIGEKVITVKYENVSTTVKVYVESGVSGIYGLTASLKSSVSTQVPAGTSLKLTKDDLTLVLLGATDNENAQITAFTVKHNDTEVTAEGLDFAISDTAYVLTVTATVSDGTDTDTLTATLEVTVSQVSTAPVQSFIAPDTVPTSNATVAANGVITENNLFKAIAGGEMTYSEGDPSKSSMTGGKVKITLQNGTEKVVKTGLRTAMTANAGDKTSEIRITAKEKVTLRVYAVFSNSSFNSNKAGKLNYKVDSGTVTTVDTGSDRNAPNVIEITLEAGKTLIIDSDKGADKGHLYLFGIEAKQITE